MTVFSSPFENIVALGKTTNWDVAGPVHKILNSTTVEPSVSRNTVQATDTGSGGGLPTSQKVSGEDVSMSTASQLSFCGGIFNILAAFMGDYTPGGEQTAGEGDFLHTMAFAAASEYFNTIVYKTQSDTVREILATKWQQFTLNMPVNDIITASASGLSNRSLYSDKETVVNGAAALDLLPAKDIDLACMAGANMYLRVAPFSTTTPLDATNEIKFNNIQLQFNRTFTASRVARGADTKYIVEPKETARPSITLTITLDEQDKATLDFLEEYCEDRELMAEIFFDADPIGAGLNRSVKIQIPKMQVGTAGPGGVGVSSTAIFAPSQAFTVLQTAVAPAGMAGVLAPTVELVNSDSVDLV